MATAQIQVIASDNVHVSSVLITITGEDGAFLEQGEAVERISSQWAYETSTPGRITVQARDLAGNVTVHDVFAATQ